MKTRLSIALLATAASLAACTGRLEPQYLDSTDKVLSIQPVGSVAATKAGPIDGTVFPNSYNMVVSAYYNASEGESTNYFSGITFSRNASTGRWDEAKYWPMSGTLNLLAYSANDGTSNVVSGSPVYQTKNTDGVTLTVTDNRTAQVDILHGQVEEKVWEATGVPMQFKHAQAALAFVAKSNVAYNATRNEGITITKITLNDAKYSGTLAISKTEAAGTAPENGYCVWSALGSQAAKDLPGVGTGYDVPAAYLDVTSAGNHFGIGGTGIMVPEQAQTSFTIEYTMHNGFEANGTTKNDYAQMVYTHTLSGNWVESKKYVYELNFTLNKIEVTPTVLDWNTESSEVQIPEPPATIAGLTFASGPLAYEGGKYVIKDSWNYSSYNSAYGKTEGSTYFNFIEMGQLFEKADFSSSDGDIENNLDPLGGWRLPTIEEWLNVVTTDSSVRSGSTVNGTANAHWAYIQLTDVTFAGNSNPVGLLIFPDEKTLTGKAFTYVDTYGITNFTLDELNGYLEKGCVFLPQAGHYYNSNQWGRNQGRIWSSTELDGTDGMLLEFYDCEPYDEFYGKDNNYYPIWLCKNVSESTAPADPANGHAYVDLGLRRTIGGVEYKVLFADRNIGASSPEDYGDYFAWGETSVRYTGISGDSVTGATFEWSNALYHTGTNADTNWTKYIPTGQESYWSGEGSPDNKLVLDASDDIASILWGGDWRMPDKEELQLLVDETKVNIQRVTNYNSTGAIGLLITGKGEFASASIFLPYAGNIKENQRERRPWGITVWSRSLNTNYPEYAIDLVVDLDIEGIAGEMQYYVSGYTERYCGESIRPVLLIPTGE